MKRNRPNPCRSTLIAMLILLGIAHLAEAANGKPTQAGTNDAQKASAAVKRDPFWPVGYVPKNVQTRSSATGESKEVVAGGWSEAMKKIVINGVSSRADNEYCAVINGVVKSVGDTVSVKLGGSVYTWAVDGIEPPGSVKLRRVSVQ